MSGAPPPSPPRRGVSSHLHRVRRWAPVLAIALACPPARGDMPAVVTIGYLAAKVEEAIDFMSPVTRLVERKLAARGVREVGLTVVPSIPEMTELLRSGKVDVFVSTPYPVLRIKRMGGPEPVLYGVSAWPRRTVFLVRKDSGIRSLADLDGKRVALTLTYSTPGYFLPRAHLTAHGFGLDRPGPTGRMVLTSLTGGGTNSLYWVHFGRADCAAVGLDEVDAVAPRVRDSLVSIDRTEEFPAFLAVLSQARPPHVRRALLALMTGLHRDPEGLVLLRRVYGCDRMEPPTRAVREQLERLERLIPTEAVETCPTRPGSLTWLRARSIVERPWEAATDLLAFFLGIPLPPPPTGARPR